MIKCACGCGKSLEKRDGRGRKRIFIHGHNNTKERHWNWKGVNVKYGGLHDWVVLHLGKAKSCSNCGVVKKYIDWANKDHKYKRDLSDYIALCRSCHRNYDIKFNNYGRKKQKI